MPKTFVSISAYVSENKNQYRQKCVVAIKRGERFSTIDAANLPLLFHYSNSLRGYNIIIVIRQHHTWMARVCLFTCLIASHSIWLSSFWYTYVRTYIALHSVKTFFLLNKCSKFLKLARAHFLITLKTKVK